eukprot:m.342095 g.342095  ORF g.342095 m.342095 type:complete len:51 (-) comp20901_c0_seq1:40-192(-)
MFLWFYTLKQEEKYKSNKKCVTDLYVIISKFWFYLVDKYSLKSLTPKVTP